jgi:hypothetical protein
MAVSDFRALPEMLSMRPRASGRASTPRKCMGLSDAGGVASNGSIALAD